MEFHKMLALSTGHLTVDTRVLMDNRPRLNRLPILYAKAGYGWFVHVPEKVSDMPQDCPTDLEACLHLAHAQGCGWIMFDRDVDAIDQLPTFEDK